MKRILLVLSVLILLVSWCVSAAGAEEAFRFTRENFPVMDGSTSMVPLGQAIASVLLGESREDAANLISFNRTTQSFRNLRDGYCDIVIAAEPKNEVFDEMHQAGFPYLLEPIAKEALVFVVNAANPVDSLTQQQVRDIYSGAVTNWSQVGGADLPIEAFQRNPTAGSQVMMEKLVMDGTPMMEAPATHIPTEMGELIEAVRSYDNSANAIGYTVFYYASDMQMADGLKILKIDGVEPSAATIRAERYPYLNGYYCCIPAQTAPDSPERRMFDWLVSEAGQALLTREGYVSAYAPGEAPRSGSDVAVNDRHYLPSVSIQPVYTLFDCSHDHLEPREDYGLIYPYSGAQLYSSWGDDSMDWYSGTMSGFYNHDGQLITDPIFSYVSKAYFTQKWTGMDFFWVVSEDGDRYGFASQDGSVMSDLCYENVRTMGDYILCTRSYEDALFDIYDRNFQLVYTQDDFLVQGQRCIPEEAAEGKWICRTPGYEDETYFLMDADRKVLLESSQYISIDLCGQVTVRDENWKAVLLDDNRNPVMLGEYEAVDGMYPLNDRFYEVWVNDYTETIICARNGSLFEWDFTNCSGYYDGCFSVTRGDTSTLYDERGRVVVNGYPIAWEYMGEGDMFYETGDGGVVLHRVSDGASLTVPGGEYAYLLEEGRYVVSTYEDEHWGFWLVDSELNLSPWHSGDLMLCTDRYNGKNYLLISDNHGAVIEQTLLTMDGETELMRAIGWISMENDCLVLTEENAFTAYNPQGGVLFSYPNYGFGNGD